MLGFAFLWQSRLMRETASIETRCTAASTPRSTAAAAACGTGTSRAAASSGRIRCSTSSGWRRTTSCSASARSAGSCIPTTSSSTSSPTQLADAEHLLDRPRLPHAPRARQLGLAARALRAGAAGRTSRSAHLIGIAVDITEQKRLAEESATADMRLRDAIEAISEAFVLWDADNRLVLCNSKFQSLHGLPDDAVAPGTPYEEIVGGRQQADRAHAIVERGPRRSRRAHLRGAARGRPLAADQRAAHQGRRLRLGRHRHHRAQAARGAADREREAAEGDGRRPALLAADARAPDPAARRSGREIRRGEGPRRGGQPGQVGIPRQHEPRAAHAAQRHHRLLRDHGVRHVRPARRREISSNTAATSARAGATCSTSSTTFSTCRRSRPAARSSSPRRSSSTPSWPTRCALVAARARREAARHRWPRSSRRSGCSADRRALKQIILNLLSNAVKFTPDGGRITVRARAVGGYVNIAIEDTGIGIPKDALTQARPAVRAGREPVHQDASRLGPRPRHREIADRAARRRDAHPLHARRRHDRAGAPAARRPDGG